MARSIGLPKTGGRKKGTPNKRTLAFSEVLDSHGIELLSEILSHAASISEQDRIGIYLGLLPYQYPKRKPTDIQAPSLNDSIDLLTKEELHRLWRKIGDKLGHNIKSIDLNKEQLLEMKSTIDDLLRLKSLENELGEPDNVF
ncbi:hypothetical protein [Bdellovibrio bacteriovorus]|uniref:hypothetical protein n=1 Tax=Bdellovibrio bacteriovorus TaxID=959 RepID=UPI0035A5FA39